ncbi:MAG: YbaB/EbfC family nucleoid-associated protein [Bacteroidia bacterium]
MIDKLMQAQQKAEEIKQKLNTIHVKGEAGNNKVVVTLNANKAFVDITLADELLSAERKEELQDLIGIAFEKAIEKAETTAQQETMSIMSSMMPGLGNIFGK